MGASALLLAALAAATCGCPPPEVKPQAAATPASAPAAPSFNFAAPVPYEPVPKRSDAGQHLLTRVAATPARRPASVSRSTLHLEAGDPTSRVARANQAARIQPSRGGYAMAAQVYPYSEGGLFQVYTAPGQVTDIVLQEGENLSGTGPVAAGDTTRWVIGDTESGSGAKRRIHILVKPTRADLQTNLVINTDRRTYHIELRATPATYMASVAWSYPRDDKPAAETVEQLAIPPVALENLNFAYRIEGAKTAWRPVRVFDDGRQTVIEFAAAISQSEMPPLFIDAGRGRGPELVNYRVNGQRMIVDRLFDAAELKLGDRRGRQKVRIVRTAGR